MKNLLDRIIQHEGGATVTDDPADSGGKTQYGISQRAHPGAWSDGRVTLEEARDIYWKDYVQAERLDQIPNPYLFQQLVDFGVTAGPDTAVRLLQRTLGVTADGELGPGTLHAIATFPAQSFYGMSLPGTVAINLAFERARTAFYIRLAQKRPKDLKWLWGWVRRTFSWSSDAVS